MKIPDGYGIFAQVLAFILGSCIFSFLNVVIYRAPKKLDFVRGRSRCDSCERTLTPLEMIPVLSFLFLRGRCRTCGKPIGVRCVFVELLGGVLAVLCVRHYAMDVFKLFTVFALLCILTVIAFIDEDTMEIGNGTLIATLLISILSVFTIPEIGLINRVIGAFCVSVPMFLMALLIDGAFGGGDIRLMWILGLFLGWKLTLLSTVFAFLFGGIAAIFLLLSHKKGRKDHFPFGPYLCLGAAVGLFYGEPVLNWYLSILHW